MNTIKHKGLSLIEMLITLTMLSVMGMAATHLHTAYSKQKLYEAKSNLSLLIRRARQDALILQTRITLCALSPAGACKQDWSGSLSAFMDSNGNRKLDAGEMEISRIGIHPNVVLRWKGMKPNNSIHFSPSGFTFVSNGTFTLCLPQHQEALELVINKQGRPRLEHSMQDCKS